MDDWMKKFNEIGAQMERADKLFDTRGHRVFMYVLNPAIAETMEWFVQQDVTTLPPPIVSLCNCLEGGYAYHYLDLGQEISVLEDEKRKLLRDAIRFEPTEGGESMNTTEASGRTLTVEYEMEENITEDQAKELINQNAPSGFRVQSINLDEQSS